MEKIRIGIVGVGNCASSLVQGLYYYKDKSPEQVAGLMHEQIGPYKPSDIEVVSAFDIDQRKVGKDLSDAIFSPPNNTTIFHSNIQKTDTTVKMGQILDGVASHMRNYSSHQTFLPANQLQLSKQDIIKELENSGTQVLLNYLPVGSEQAARLYTECSLEAKAALINCMPVFIASDKSWAKKFRQANLPVIGDDVKSQVGATIIHRMLARLLTDRGVQLQRTYQLNTGGNTDFLNMLALERLTNKKISKTQAVQSQLPIPLSGENIHIGPSDYIAWQKDNKICFLRIEWKGFGNIPNNLELRLSVEDSPNSAGIAIDAIRCAKLALDKGINGPLIGPSAYFMKHPPQQYTDEQARQLTEEFIWRK